MEAPKEWRDGDELYVYYGEHVTALMVIIPKETKRYTEMATAVRRYVSKRLGRPFQQSMRRYGRPTEYLLSGVEDQTEEAAKFLEARKAGRLTETWWARYDPGTRECEAIEFEAADEKGEADHEA